MKIEDLRIKVVFILSPCLLSGEGKNGGHFLTFHSHQPSASLMFRFANTVTYVTRSIQSKLLTFLGLARRRQHVALSK